jgi:hypothetical protein
LITFLINHIYCHLICTLHELRVVNPTEPVYITKEWVTKKGILVSHKEAISTLSATIEIKEFTSGEVDLDIAWLIPAPVRNAPAKPIRIFLLNKR